MFLFSGRGLLRQCLSLTAIISVLALASAYAQTANHTYDVELVVSNGKKSVETDADIIFTEKSFKVVPDKTEFQSSTKVIEYKDITQADHSYSKKPMLSGGGAIATAILIGIVALPLLFIKKKKHWLSVQAKGEGNFAVIKLGDQNFRQIVAELQSHDVKVNELKDEGK
jgi:DNA helicase IV